MSFAFIFTNCKDKDDAKETGGAIITILSPKLTTNDAADSGPLGAICGGTITENANYVLKAGICWTNSETDDPSLPSDFSSLKDESLVTALLNAVKNEMSNENLFSLSSTPLTDIIANKTFSCSMYGVPNKTYKVRAFVVSALGISYGDTKTFKTTSFLETNGTNTPNLTTTGVEDITKNSAVAKGSITETNGTILMKGVCWQEASLLTELLIGDDKCLYNLAEKGASDADFKVSMKGLLSGHSYKYKVFATNANGISYGEELTFTIDE